MAGSRPLSLDQFIALNEEMAALVRAGVPLNRGLVDLGNDVPGRLGAMASAFGQRLERGESLEQIIADEKNGFPPLFRAIVLAGIRAGNLATALQGLATTTRRVREMRRIVGMAMVYPLIVVVLAIVLFGVVAQRWAPVIVEAYRQWDVTRDRFIRGVAWLGDHVWDWAPWIPLGIVLLGLAWWWRSGRAARVQVSGRVFFGVRLPTLARLSRAGRMASFADVLRLLIEHRVPLPEALALAGQASGDRRLETDARRLAERWSQGGAGSLAELRDPSFPPLLMWLLAGGAPEAQLVSALDHLARAYRHETLRLTAWLSLYLPLILTALIGGTVVLAYGLSILGPVFYLMKEMGQP